MSAVTHAELLAAVRTIDELLGIGDAIYTVRASAFEHEPFDGGSWDHPRVKRYSAAVAVVERALRGDGA